MTIVPFASPGPGCLVTCSCGARFFPRTGEEGRDVCCPLCSSRSYAASIAGLAETRAAIQQQGLAREQLAAGGSR